MNLRSDQKKAETRAVLAVAFACDVLIGATV